MSTAVAQEANSPSESTWIASPATPIITQYVRRGDEWIVRSITGRDAILHSEALDLDLALENVYDLVETEPEAEPEATESVPEANDA